MLAASSMSRPLGTPAEPFARVRRCLRGIADQPSSRGGPMKRRATSKHVIKILSTPGVQAVSGTVSSQITRALSN
jgi:hypothetical protein